jgi:hypothetical protein
VIKAHKEPQAAQAHKVRQGLQAPPEQLVQKAILDLQDQKDLRDLRAHKEPQAAQAHKGQKAILAIQDHKGSLDQLALLALLAHKALRDQQDLQGQQVVQDQLGHKDLQVQLGHRGHKAMQAPMDKMPTQTQ